MAPRATGGPDAFGYTWQDAIGSIQLVDLSATGTLALPGISDDSHQGLLPLPFSFNFYGTNYNTFSVGTNGVVYFEDAYLGLANQCPLPAAQSYTPQRFIAVYHDDLIVRGGIYYQSFSTCPIGCASACLLIHFDNMDNFGSSGDNMQFNVALYPDGSILVIYGEQGLKKALVQLLAFKEIQRPMHCSIVATLCLFSTDLLLDTSTLQGGSASLELSRRNKPAPPGDQSTTTL